MSHRRETVEFTNICLVYKGDRILVQERTKSDWPGLTFPGGHAEAGESFDDAVKREVYEETGLILHKAVLCGIEEYRTEDEDRNVMLYYKSDDFSGELKSSKEGRVFWIGKDELGQYELSLDLERIYAIMTSDTLSELVYYREDGEWKSKTV